GVDIHIAERHVVHELEPQHYHPRHPEKDDIERGYEHAGGIIFRERRGLFRPAEGRERPESGGKPGVQHVLVLPDLLRPAVSAPVWIVDLHGDFSAIIAVEGRY